MAGSLLYGDSLRATLRGRTRNSARKLWASIPAVYRQCAVVYTDFLGRLQQGYSE